MKNQTESEMSGEINVNIPQTGVNKYVETSPEDITAAEIQKPSQPCSRFSNDRLEYTKEEHAHEREMAKYGYFGKIFGAEENSSKAITFVILLVILSMWFALTLWIPFLPAAQDIEVKLFELIIPLITLAFGYFFGKK